MSLNLEGAISFACIAHAGQTRMSGRPYIVHPLRVMLAVSPRARIAAVLHDVLEDYGDIPDTVDEVSYLAVALLTHNKNKDTYAEYVQKIAEAEGPEGEIAREVKLADLRDNLMSCPLDRYELASRYRDAIETIQESDVEEVAQTCRYCGAVYGLGEACKDCLKKCDCPWNLGLGPNLKCPIHGLPQHRLPTVKGMN